MNELNHHNDRIAALVFKYLLHDLSADEQAALDQWLQAAPENQAEFNELLHRARLETQWQNYNEVNTEDIWQRITEQVPELEAADMRQPRNRWARWMAAASVILLISAGALYYINSKKNQHTTETIASVTNDVAPGGNKAVLTLANGNRIVLDNAQKGTVAREGGTAINKTQEGQLVYDKSNEASHTAAPLAYNTISTPRGGQYHVVLPDGSNVWMNAASMIRFPAHFTGNERNVAVSGEVYFEVAKDKAKPFIVSIIGKDGKPGGRHIEVLGTHFNVHAYSDDDYMNTTLLEGSIQFTTIAAGGSSITKKLSPGQQAVVKETDRITVVDKDDPEGSIAWIKGNFSFDGVGFAAMMRELSRWYDVTVVYEAPVPSNTLVGQIDRTIPLSKLLSQLEKMSNVHFKIEGRTVKVSP